MTWHWAGWKKSGSDRPKSTPGGDDLPAAAGQNGLPEKPSRRSEEAGAARSAARPPPQRWALSRKFLDYLEANAEEYWQVPRFEMAAEILGGRRPPAAAAENRTAGRTGEPAGRGCGGDPLATRNSRARIRRNPRPTACSMRPTKA